MTRNLMTAAVILGALIGFGATSDIGRAEEPSEFRATRKTDGKEITDFPRLHDHYYLNNGAHHNAHAYRHVRLLRRYAESGVQLPAGVVKEQAAVVRDNLQSASRSLAKISDDAKADPTVAKRLTEIQERLTKLAAHVDRLEATATNDAAKFQSITTEIGTLLKENHTATKAIAPAVSGSNSSGGNSPAGFSDDVFPNEEPYAG